MGVAVLGELIACVGLPAGMHCHLSGWIPQVI